MKKELLNCSECGETNSILCQVASSIEPTFLCTDCYKFKYSKEERKEIEEDYLIPNFLKN